MTLVRGIEALHQALVRDVRGVTGMQLSIRPSAENWQKVVCNSRISFDMFRRLRQGAAWIDSPATALRKRGGRCPVLPLSGDSISLENQVWAAWHEEWDCERRSEFDLVGAGWTFFWGTEGRLGRDQEIVRAEWDQVHRRGGFAAQPHWHLDTGMMAGYTRPVLRDPPPKQATELEETASVSESALEEVGKISGIQELDLSAMHLGMGGWQNHNGHPRCWQKQVAGELTELVLWAVRTLELACDQFKELDINEIVV